MRDIELVMNEFRLATAEITYYFPDYPLLLQIYLWQEYDKAPNFPVLTKFIEFWNRELEGKIHSITVSSSGLIKPVTFRTLSGEFLV